MPSTSDTHRAARIAALAVIAALATAACRASSPSPASSSAPTAPPAAASATPASTVVPSPSTAATATLLLEVRFEGGFINPAARIGALPTVVVDTAGRFYLPDSTLGGPMIPRVLVRDTGPAGAAAVLDAARKAGLADGSAGGGGIAADAGVAVVTLDVNGTEVVSRLVGPGGPRPPGAPGPSSDPGATDDASPSSGGAAVDLVAQLTDTSLAWGGSTAPVATYQPTAYRLWVAPAAGGDAAPAPAAPWPLATDPAAFGTPAAAEFGVDGLRSGVVSGADATRLAAALGAVPAGSLLTVGGKLWQVWVSPVLPVETGG
jgi:hypothetical protein